ncbi:MAG: XRE family transcriptional regulator [Ruminococcus sp.]|nr:XRE family transcriptional regulator [Ruminococcus sp.]
MLDVNKLKGKIIEKGKNVEAVALDIGIDSSTFYRKMKNNSFEIEEADKIVKVLELSRDDAMSIFFS